MSETKQGPPMTERLSAEEMAERIVCDWNGCSPTHHLISRSEHQRWERRVVSLLSSSRAEIARLEARVSELWAAVDFIISRCCGHHDGTCDGWKCQFVCQPCEKRREE